MIHLSPDQKLSMLLDQPVDEGCANSDPASLQEVVDEFGPDPIPMTYFAYAGKDEFDIFVAAIERQDQEEFKERESA